MITRSNRSFKNSVGKQVAESQIVRDGHNHSGKAGKWLGKWANEMGYIDGGRMSTLLSEERENNNIVVFP